MLLFQPVNQKISKLYPMIVKYNLNTLEFYLDLEVVTVK